MQNAQSVFLKTVEDLLLEGEIEKAIDVLLEFENQAQIGIRQDLLQQSGNYQRAKKMFNDNLIDSREFKMDAAKASHALSELLKDIPKKIDLNARINGFKTFAFEVPSDDHLEKVIGGKSSILRINWLEKALNAGKAVCRVVCANGDLGTGFITKDGYLFTNNHVIPTKESAATARIEFNYELDSAGNVKNRTTYELDAQDFLFSPKEQLDFSRVKIKDRNDQPLKNWGFVEFETEAIPSVGEAVTIIQHPKGEDKQIALNANEVLGQLNQHLYYTTDTEPGSSGSPVFNKDWKVVAIHHAGKTMAEGGFKVNAQGDVREANRGILFRNIFGLINTGKTNAVASDSGKTENFTPDSNPTTPALKDPTPVNTPIEQPKVSAVPKFVVLYDIADDAQCKLLNKHLNFLKITKKIRVYNVQEAAPGTDPLNEAKREMSDADYLVLLISANLLASDWFATAFEALEAGKRLIPIKIAPVDISGLGFDKLKSLPSGNRNVEDFPNPDAAYTDIAGELKKLVP
ncbi:MAG: trypsin-like peptidase domain-containing protein [Bacteroidetes bacterium]|nr:trypsin-like peptidase domain-containing protein [Bacteroidota bacterium]